MSSNAIAVRGESTGLAIRPGQEMWTDKQRAALTVLGIKGASNADLAVFMHYCQKTGLDPFSRQIYMICRREKQGDNWVDKQTIQVGIDGFRVIRDRIAARLGVSVEYEDTIWYDGDGGAHKVWLWDYPPAACNVTVIKDGKRFPGVVRFASYAATNRNGDLVSQWKSQPDHMIEKCAEAYALRRAFPHDLGGIHLEDEVPPLSADEQRPPLRVTAAEIISQTPEPAAERVTRTARHRPAAAEAAPEPGPDAGPEERPEPRAATGQVGIIRSLFAGLGFEEHERDERLAITARLAGVDDLATTKDLTQDQAQRVQGFLKRCEDRPALVALLASDEAPDGGA